MYASEGDLERALSLCENIAVFFGGVIVAGVVLEIWLAFARFPPESLLGHWGPVWADVLIAVGVGLEVAFGFRGSGLQSELTRRSNAKLKDAYRWSAAAMERADSAENRLADAEGDLAAAWTLLEKAKEDSSVALALLHGEDPYNPRD